MHCDRIIRPSNVSTYLAECVEMFASFLIFLFSGVFRCLESLIVCRNALKFMVSNQYLFLLSGGVGDFVWTLKIVSL